MDNISKKSIEQALNDPEFSFIGSFSDASDTTKVRQEITKLLFRHRETRKLLKIRERERVTLNKNYEKRKENLILNIVNLLQLLRKLKQS